jgi:glycosyltransferase involved in cell wall biosynthesis
MKRSMPADNPTGHPARVLFLVSDAFGGHGGISRFNCDLANALAASPALGALTILPRRVPHPVTGLPHRTVQRAAPPGKLGFAAVAALEALKGHDLILCGHINLLPVATVAQRLARRGGRRPRLVLVIHGVDAWQPISVSGLACVDYVLSVSQFTLDAFRSWHSIPADRCFVLPNTTDTSLFVPGPRPAALEARYGLVGATTVLGFARLQAEERQKGFDEMLAALPLLIARHPRLKYLICGDGTDRPRLMAEVGRLGLGDHVVFAGYVPEAEKADHYRLADAFVLCGRQEGFGIVLLEAMGCGVPVVASRIDGSREAVLDGALGELADPGDIADLAAAVDRALGRSRPHVPPGLAATFGHDAFRKRAGSLLDTWLAAGHP